jgi:hypothetical protein
MFENECAEVVKEAFAGRFGGLLLHLVAEVNLGLVETTVEPMSNVRRFCNL